MRAVGRTLILYSAAVNGRCFLPAAAVVAVALVHVHWLVLVLLRPFELDLLALAAILHSTGFQAIQSLKEGIQKEQYNVRMLQALRPSRRLVAWSRVRGPIFLFGW